ncbi:MAG TPA: hypothetical protein VEK08_26255 [Planctomycetota bacterium]|nr:hypothetical protein [Planctomycetota bacterium]
MWPLIAGGLVTALSSGLLAAAAWKKNIHNWLPGYLRWRPEPFRPDQPLHLYFCFADHYEPLWAGADVRTGLERVQRWVREYPPLVDSFRDSDGRPAQHSFFFPAEEYRPEFLNLLQGLCSRGYGDVEVHLHHDNDTPANFCETIEQFIEKLQGHGFLLNRDPRNRFGFIHGNWCLDNSRKDGRWCGINNEINLLRALGCYADFTFPSAPSDTQPAIVNAIYYARDDESRPKSHNTGRRARVGVLPADDELCLITGPLGLNWHSRKFGLLPRIENADVSGGLTADARRCRAWMNLGSRVIGAPNHVFVKVHTHGTQERIHSCVLGEQARVMYRSLSEMEREGVQLHFVTAYEMWQKVRQLELGSLEMFKLSARALGSPKAGSLAK